MEPSNNDDANEQNVSGHGETGKKPNPEFEWDELDERALLTWGDESPAAR